MWINLLCPTAGLLSLKRTFIWKIHLKNENMIIWSHLAENHSPKIHMQTNIQQDSELKEGCSEKVSEDCYPLQQAGWTGRRQVWGFHGCVTNQCNRIESQQTCPESNAGRCFLECICWLGMQLLMQTTVADEAKKKINSIVFFSNWIGFFFEASLVQQMLEWIHRFSNIFFRRHLAFLCICGKFFSFFLFGFWFFLIFFVQQNTNCQWNCDLWSQHELGTVGPKYSIS